MFSYSLRMGNFIYGLKNWSCSCLLDYNAWQLLKDKSTNCKDRVKLSNGRSYVIDLDIQTIKRVKGFLHATENKKRSWISDDPT